MTFTQILNNVLAHWPSVISVADAIVIEPRSKPKKSQLILPNLSNSYYSENLTNAWTSAREATAHENNFSKLMVWTIYELLNRKLREGFASGLTELRVSELDPAELEEQFYRNLQEEGTEEELKSYKRKQDNL